MTLAELLAEAKRLDVKHESFGYRVSFLNERDAFRVRNFPRLVRVAEAAMRMRRHTGVPDHWCPEHCTFCESVAAFDAEVRGEK